MHDARPAAALAACSLLLAGIATAQAPDGWTVEVELARSPALSQDRTGTCWCYSTTSFLESELHRIHGRWIDLSEMHTVYWAWVEKAERFVRLHGQTQLGEGGLSHDLLWLIERHGLAPQAAYDGLVAGSTRHDHGELETVLAAALEPLAKSGPRDDRWRDAVRGVLDGYLGRVPDSFEFDGRNLTAREFAAGLRLPVDRYRQLMSLRSEVFGGEAELLVPDNWLRHQRYWNVPVAELLANLDHVLRAGYTAAIDIDVSEPRPRRRDGIWELPAELERDGAVDDDVRQRLFDSRATTDDHLMHAVGIARDPEGRAYYLVKNSHGDRPPLAGHVLVSRAYMAAKLLSFMAHEDGLVPATRTKFGAGAGAR